MADSMSPYPRSAFVPVPGSERSPVAGAVPVGPASPADTVNVTVVLHPKASLPEAPDRPPAPLPADGVAAHHDTYADAYGAHDDAILAVTDYARSQGLDVTNVDAKRRVVQLSGPVAAAERAFGVTLNEFERDSSRFRGRDGAVLLPPDIASQVEAVLGLDSRPVARPRVAPRAAPATSYFPNQLARLYAFPSGDGAGQTIALIELGGNYDEGDLRRYFSEAGTPMPNVRRVAVSPGKPVPYGADPDSDGEVMLDVEVVGAIAPGARIVVYFAENSDAAFYDAVSRAVHDPATTAVSISWGGAEVFWSSQTMNAWETLAQSAAALHVNVFAASGDHGSPDQSLPGVDGHRHVDFPASAPHIIACGGTNIQTSGTHITNETVWNNHNGWATGGGASAHFTVPSWQNGLSAEGGVRLTKRGVPDVSGDADPNSGIKVRTNHQDGVSGGTSAVAPLWAALTALLAQHLHGKPPFLAPVLYHNAAALKDIIAGENGAFGVAGFHAQHGWDACTGLGSPIGGKLLGALAAAPAPAKV
ncbi:MAG TPA: S53 family peptidase [Candidatus Elarobacter sp.]|jgi:kumamolisin